MSDNALDQKLLEELIIGALNRDRAPRPGDAESTVGETSWPGTDVRPPRRVLVVGDQEHVADKLNEALSSLDVETVYARTRAEALAAFKTQGFDVLLVPLRAEPTSGAGDLMHELVQLDPDVPAILLAPYGALADAVTALHRGAVDWVIEPFAAPLLRAKVQKALDRAALLRRCRVLEQRCARFEAQLPQASSLVTLSASMQHVVAVTDRAAASDVTVVLHGERGVGKTLVARRIHARSLRKDRPFIVQSCTGPSPEQLEKELFGEDIRTDEGTLLPRLGTLELAHGGTLYFESVDAMPASVQVRLLKFLQERRVQRQGAQRSRKVDVRCIFATDKDLRAEVDKGRFRQDLYYRIHVVPVRVPPLRDRAQDISTLAQQFVDQWAEKLGTPSPPLLNPEILRALEEHRWPGNIPELRNVIEHALLTARDWMEVAQLPRILRTRGGAAEGTGGAGLMAQRDRPLPDILEELERQLIEEAYTRANKVKTETARLLGIKTSALYYKLEKYGFIQKGEGSDDER